MTSRLNHQLPKALVQIITDGYNANSEDECPYPKDDTINPVHRVFWRRGFQMKEKGYSLEQALSSDNDWSKSR